MYWNEIHNKKITLDDDSYIHNYVSPLSTQMLPNIVEEEEVDDIHANHNDHEEGELINIH